MAKHRLHPTPRRRGTTVAAGAVGLSLVLSGVQPIVSPDASQHASAETIAETSDIEGRTVSLTRPGQTVTVPPRNAVGKMDISVIRLSPRTELLPGWRADFVNGILTAGVADPLPDDFTTTQVVYVDVVFSDRSVKTIEFVLNYQEPEPSTTAEESTTEEPAPSTTEEPAPSTTAEESTTEEPEPSTTAEESTTAEPAPSTTEEPEPSTTTEESTTEEPEPSTTDEPAPSTTAEESTTEEPEPSTTAEPDPSTEESTTAEPEPSTTAEPAPSTTAGTSTSAQPSTKPKPLDQYAWNNATVGAGERAVLYPVRLPATAVPVRAIRGVPSWVSVDSSGMIVAEPTRQTNPGNYVFTVGTDAGERDVITITVTAAVSDTERITPNYRIGYARAGGYPGTNQPPMATITRGRSTFQNQQVPSGTTFSTDYPGARVNESGSVTIQAPLDATEGAIISVPVTLTYPDGSKDTAVARFEVIKAEYAKTFQPVYETGRGAKPGRTVAVKQVKTNLPDYTEFSLKDPAAHYGGWDIVVDGKTGHISATAPQDAPQPQDFLVHVTYSDGSWEDVPARVEALGGEAESDTAAPVNYSAPFVRSDGKIVLRPDGGVPAGATFGKGAQQQALPVVVEEDGTVIIDLPESGLPGAGFDVAFQMTFPDGSVRDFSLPVQTQSQAAKCDATWPPISVVENGVPKTVLPASSAQTAVRYELGASFDVPGWSASVDASTGALTVARMEALNSPSATSVPIVITYQDGSQREAEVRVFTARGAAAVTPLTYGEVALKPGEKATLSPTHPAKSFSLVNRVPGLRTTIDPATGALTVEALPGATPGPRVVEVEVMFADDSHLVTTANVTVVPASNGVAEVGDGVDEEASSSKSSEGAKIVGIVAGLLGLLGLLAAGLYNNREFFQTFLVWWK